MLTGGFIAAMVFLLFLLPVTSLAVFVTVKCWKDEYTDSADRAFITGVSLTGIIFVVLTLVTLFPYSMEHHSYKPVSGTVIQVDKKFMSDGDSTTESINLNINGVDYTVDDSRAATIRRGDSVNLKCVKDWNYGAEDGWNCKWNGVNK